MANQIDFDPKRAANWFGGIARAMREHSVDWASIDNLADRTLRAMDILTRSKPRERLLADIKKAIKTLCRQGVLFEYRTGKVRIADTGRLDRYLTSSPKPHAPEGEAAKPAEKRAELGGNASSHGSPETQEGRQPSLVLPPLSLIDSDEEESGTAGTTGSVASDDDDDPEQEAIRILMGGSSAQKASADRPGPSASAEPPTRGDAVPGQGEFLDELATALHQASSSWRASVAGNVLTGSWRSESIKIELRRDGSLRGALEFPASDLAQVLRRIRSNWQLASVGVDSRGIPALLYRWPGSTAAADVVDDIERGLDLLDDARSDV